MVIKYKFSVIIPAYNAETVLECAVKSVLAQTYQNYEVIIIDDGSTDGTPVLCEYFKGTNNNVKIIRQKNAGPSKARQRGIDVAQGEYIVFLDADDYFFSDAFSTLNMIIELKKCDILQFSYQMVNNDGSVICKKRMKRESFDNNYDSFRSFIKQENCTNYLWNKIYKRSIFDNLEWPKLFYSEDYFLLVQLYGRAKNVFTISDVLYCYVQNEQSAVHQSFNMKFLDQIKAGEYAVRFTKQYFPDFVPEALFYLATHSARLTVMAYLSSIENKNEVMRFTKEIFKKSYKELRATLRNQKRKIQLDRMTRLFAMSPTFVLCLKKIQFKNQTKIGR
ncbi:glycosyltransferase family 2 protein [Ruminococcus flavefaciens]|uniref:glycosyltransferase family 2 protein n=1 Tax=Ruminococcus flavefaciens TaxID=1265 RepID=UPI00048CCC23|nr:glycosyltransferase family A protein [Ruminococcus flavefaciens]